MKQVSIRNLVSAAVMLAAGLFSASPVHPLSSDHTALERVTQLLPLKYGRVLAITSAKGGLYLAGEEGLIRRVEGAPGVFIHRAAVLPSGDVFLATAAGIYRAEGPDLSFKKVAEGNAGLIAFSSDGSLALLKLWGKGLFEAATRDLTLERFLEQGERAKRKASLERQAFSLNRELLSADTGKMTADQTKAYLRKFSQWQQLEEEIKNLDAPVGVFRRAGDGLDNATVQSLAALPEGGWIAGAFGRGVYSVSPTDKVWRALKDVKETQRVLCVGASPWGDWYAGTYGAGLLVRSGEEAKWRLALGEGMVVQDMAFGNGQWVLAGTRENGVFFSKDRGSNWGKALETNNVQAVAVDSMGLFWAAIKKEGLFLSKDRGATWTRAGNEGTR